MHRFNYQRFANFVVKFSKVGATWDLRSSQICHLFKPKLGEIRRKVAQICHLNVPNLSPYCTRFVTFLAIFASLNYCASICYRGQNFSDIFNKFSQYIKSKLLILYMTLVIILFNVFTPQGLIISKKIASQKGG